MGLRSPQQMQITKLRPQGTTRFSGGQAPRIGTEFASQIARNVTDTENARIKAEQDQLQFVRAQAENTADNLRVEAQGKLASTEGVTSLEASTKISEDLR